MDSGNAVGEWRAAGPGKRPWGRRLAIALGLFAVATLVAALGSEGLRRRAEDRWPREPADRRALFVPTAEGELRALLAKTLPAGDRARPILLLHGAFGGAEDWAATVLDRVGERGYALAFDRPGHGYSAGEPLARGTPEEQARRIWLAVDSLGLEPPIVVGFSYGAAVALALAVERPGEVAGLLLVAPASHPWPGSVDIGYRIAGAPVLGPLLSRTWLAPLAHLVAPISSGRSFAPGDEPESFRASPLGLALSPPRLRSNTEDMRHLRGALAAQAPGYGGLDLPVVVLQGRGDVIVSPRIHAEALAAAVPGAELVWVDGGGHQLPYSHPDEVLAALDRLLALATP